MTKPFWRYFTSKWIFREKNPKIRISLNLSGWPFGTVDVRKLIFWAAYSAPELFNCKHKPFISTVLANANRLMTYAGHSHG